MKLQRQRKIIDLVEEFEIETQEELAQRLQEAGYAATQSTISRDIRELNLQKNANSRGKLVYSTAQERGNDADGRNFRVFREAFVSVDVSQNSLVIRTASGMAMAAAAVLDEMKWEEVLGCIAGDDTIMCVVRDAQSSRLVMDRLQSVLEDGE